MLFCENEPETLVHFLWSCKKTRIIFWTTLENWLNWTKMLGQNKTISKLDAIRLNVQQWKTHTLASAFVN